MRPTVALFGDFAVFVVAPQGKTTVSFSQPRAPLSAGLFFVRGRLAQRIQGWHKAALPGGLCGALFRPHQSDPWVPAIGEQDPSLHQSPLNGWNSLA